MTEARWRQVWDAWPRQFDRADHLRQVAKTLGGTPISEQQVSRITATIVERLRLQPSDTLLDLCCGNGLMTARLAERCGRVVGVDFSQPLLDVARRDHMPDNVDYQLGSVNDLEHLPLRQPFTKVVMYDALQHFTPAHLRQLLRVLANMTPAPHLMMFGGVPFRPRRPRFLDTFDKRRRYWYYRLTGRDLLGTWWQARDFAEACASAGLRHEVHDQPAALYNAAFRVDVTVW
jgi:SAM-dependent methyltransferase